MRQGDLFGSEPPGPPPMPWWLRMKTLHDDGWYPTNFWDWLADNVRIYECFCETSMRAKGQGRVRWSAMAIIQIMRWERRITEIDGNELKVNNNCAPGLARLAMAENESLRGFFRIHHMGKHIHKPLANGNDTPD